MVSKYKVYNPDPNDLKLSAGEAKVYLPAKSYVIVSVEIGEYLNNQYPQLEVTESTEEAYKEYRKEAEVKAKEVEAQKEAAKEAEIERIEEEAERSEEKIEAREERKKEEREEATKVKIGLIENEAEAIKTLEETTVELHPLPELAEETKERIEAAKKEAEEEAKEEAKKVAKTNQPKKKKGK